MQHCQQGSADNLAQGQSGRGCIGPELVHQSVGELDCERHFGVADRNRTFEPLCLFEVAIGLACGDGTGPACPPVDNAPPSQNRSYLLRSGRHLAAFGEHLPALRTRPMGGVVAQAIRVWGHGYGPLRGRLCATSAKGRGGPNVCNCLIDEGRPLGTGWQEQVPNHLRRLWSKAMVVSTEGKGLERTRSGDWQGEDRKGTTDYVSKA